MQKNLDYRYLKAFQQTAIHLNFSKAADILGIAQSAVSRQVRLLEESLDEQLIIRSSKKVILTEKGISLFRAIQKFENLTDELLQTEDKKIIRVGILHGLLENWFIKIVSEFVKKSKHEIKIELGTPDTLKQDLSENKCDLIFTTENIQNELISSLKLFEERLTIISKKEIDTKKIHEYNWITYDKTDYFFDLYKKHSNQIISVASITAMIQLVKAGTGIAIVPHHSIKKEDRLFQYEIKGLKRPMIHLSTLNFQTMPAHLSQLIAIINKSI